MANKKNINILIATPIWKREDIFKIFIHNNIQYGFDILAVGSEGEKSRKLCEDLGCKYIEVENEPFGKKLNSRIDYFLKHNEYTHILFLGSDDLIDINIINTIKKLCNIYDIISWKDIYFYNIVTGECCYYTGYTTGVRKGEPLAPGRCISRKTFNKLGKKLWNDNLTKSPDANIWKKIKDANLKTIILSCKEVDGIILDVKNESNITSYDRIKNMSNKNNVTMDELNRIKKMLNI